MISLFKAFKIQLFWKLMVKKIIRFKKINLINFLYLVKMILPYIIK